jgi:hypothetical protein
MESLNNIIPLIKEVGPFICLIFFFIWRDYRREIDLSLRIRALEDYQTKELVDLAKSTIEAINGNTQVMTGLVAALRARPCLMGENR